jgi:ClpP class serine protease
MDYLSLILWLAIFLSLFYPVLQRRQIELNRLRVIANLQKKRGSRVITLIHREESISFFGIPFRKMIDIEDSEQILRVIRETPDEMPIDLILHTPGGLVLASEQIARALIRRKGKVTCFIPHYAMSGGTLIALAADEIVIDKNAVMGPIDPQLGGYPAISILKAVERKNINDLDDQTLILADIAEKAMNQVYELVIEILSDKEKEGILSREKIEEIAKELTSGKWTHDYPLTCERIKNLGLNVSFNMPEDVYILMNLYPQAGVGRPSVQFVPLPPVQPSKKSKSEHEE